MLHGLITFVRHKGETPSRTLVEKRAVLIQSIIVLAFLVIAKIFLFWLNGIPSPERSVTSDMLAICTGLQAAIVVKRSGDIREDTR